MYVVLFFLYIQLVSSTGTEKVQPEAVVEKIELKHLEIASVDKILDEFQKTFNAFFTGQENLQTAVKDFKTARKTAGEFSVCLREFKQQLNGQNVEIKKLVLKFPRAITKAGGSVGDGATALVSILKTYNEMEKLPVKVTSTTIDCLRDALGLDIEELLGEEFGGSVFNLGKIPKQITIMRNNIKEMKKAPKIVKQFFEYATSIVMSILEAFDSTDKEKEEFDKRKAKVESDLEKKDGEVKQLEEPPKEIKFSSLGVPSVDQVFADIAKLVNPVIKLSKDIFNAKERLGQAMKAVSEFRDDPSKAFDDYLEELKNRIKKGDVRIEISIEGTRIEVVKVEGLEPKFMQDLEAAFKSLLKIGDELTKLAPENIKQLIKLGKDATKFSAAEIKGHVSFKELPSKVSALNENAKKAKKIPGDLKFFLNVTKMLVTDIVRMLQAKEEKAAEENENGDTNENSIE